MKLLKKYCILKNHLQNNFWKNLFLEEEGGLPEKPTSGKNSETRPSITYSGSSSGSPPSSSGRRFFREFSGVTSSGIFPEEGSSGYRFRKRAKWPIQCLLGAPTILLGARSNSQPEDCCCQYTLARYAFDLAHSSNLILLNSINTGVVYNMI